MPDQRSLLLAMVQGGEQRIVGLQPANAFGSLDCQQ